METIKQMNDTKNNQTSDIMTKEQFAASFVRALKHGSKIAAGKEKTTNARDFIKQIRAEIEEDKLEGN